MFHQDLGPIMRQCGLSTVGENVAYGYSTGRLGGRPRWMHSEGHRANILNRAVPADGDRCAAERRRHLVRRPGLRPDG